MPAVAMGRTAGYARTGGLGLRGWLLGVLLLLGCATWVGALQLGGVPGPHDGSQDETTIGGGAPWPMRRPRALAQDVAGTGPYMGTVATKVDHFNDTDTRTFNLRYLHWDLIKDRSTTAAPVVLWLEYDRNILANNNSIYRAALLSRNLPGQLAQMGAVIVMPEQRGVGASMPGAVDPKTNLPRLLPSFLPFLTVEQILADYAALIRHLKSGQAPNMPDTITGFYAVGTSFAGTLALWMRARYPELVSGAYGSSSPLQLQPFIPMFADVMLSNIYYMKAHPPAARALVDTNRTMALLARSIKHMEKMATTAEGRTNLTRLLTMCASDPTTPVKLFDTTTYGALPGVLGTNFQVDPAIIGGVNIGMGRLLQAIYMALGQNQLLQWAHTYQYLETYPSVFSVNNQYNKTIANATLARNPIGGALATIMRFSNNPQSGPPCLSMDNWRNTYARYSYAFTDLTPTTWNWLTCNELGWFQGGDTQGFYGDGFNDYLLSMCKGFYAALGMPPSFDVLANLRKNSAALMEKVGGRDTFTATNIILVNGELDPWRPLSMSPSQAQPGQYIFHVPLQTHTQDFPGPTEPYAPPLRAVRDAVSTIFGQWFNGTEVTAPNATYRTDLPPVPLVPLPAILAADTFDPFAAEAGGAQYSTAATTTTTAPPPAATTTTGDGGSATGKATVPSVASEITATSLIYVVAAAVLAHVAAVV